MNTKKLFITSILLLSMISSCNSNKGNISSSTSENLNSIIISSGISNNSSSTSSSDKELNQEKIDQIVSGQFEFLLSSNKTSDVILIHTEEQRNYLNGDYTSIFNYADGTKEKSLPLKTTFTWTTNALEDNVVDHYTLTISENEDLTDGLVFDTEQTSYDVYNLKVNTSYYWNVSTQIADLTFTSETYHFVTEDTPIRNLYIDGVTNARDLGGWETTTGNKVKQGLLYRTGRLNKNYTNIVLREITSQGRSTMLNQLKIKTELDLRRTDNNEIGGLKGSALGETVNYYCLPMIYEADNQTVEKNKVMITKVFEVLADENNYPLFFHCSIGTDRTGLISFLVNGLLGVNEEDLYRDYLFSNFGDIGSDRKLEDILEDYVNLIKEQNGSSLQEKVENFLLDLGVKQNHLDSIKNIMLEK